jgi:hypothetical protein
MIPERIRIRVLAGQDPNDQQNKQIIFKAQIRLTVALQTCMREVFLSNLSPDTDYTD